MFCSKCGTNVAEGVAFCPNCGQATGGVTAASAAPVYGGAPVYSAPAATVQVAYAGFWLRFVAIIIDVIALAVVTFPIRLAIFGMLGIHHAMRPTFGERPDVMLGALLPALMFTAGINFVINLLYFSFCESSTWQATLGKKALGLAVTDMQGRRISFGHALGRNLAKIISSLTLFIGYIMAGITAKKQALHDMIAGTLV
ncbi:MAG TPA: RDD family protein, partial [Candidatus Acidoferrales bacterium]